MMIEPVRPSCGKYIALTPEQAQRFRNISAYRARMARSAERERVARALVLVWWRAFSIVTCVALNTTQIASGRYLAAFFTGTVLSYIWWHNTRIAAHSTAWGAHWAYAIGAGCGTVTGMWIGRMM